MKGRNPRRRAAPASTLVKPLLLLATGAAAGLVVWRVLMLEPATTSRVVTEQLSRHDRQALDGLLHQRSLRP
jgi:hypothetical protein